MKYAKIMKILPWNSFGGGLGCHLKSSLLILKASGTVAIFAKFEEDISSESDHFYICLAINARSHSH